jgi:two-component system chemotaxis response regulator CheB
MMETATAGYELVVIGGSAGSMSVLSELLPALPAEFPLPVVVALHLHPHQDGYFVEHLSGQCALAVREAEDKCAIEPGHVYFAPPNYHLLIESDRTLALSVDEKVNYSRPSIDVLFESAADRYGRRLIGVILTGANNDGAHGLRAIREKGGLAIAQDPGTAESPFMPSAALEVAGADFVLPPRKIGALLVELTQRRISPDVEARDPDR